MRGPALPESIPWGEPTRKWWSALRRSEDSKNFTPLQWQFLLDTALCHNEVWEGNLDRLSELRIRLVKFGGFVPEQVAAPESTTAERATSFADELEDRRNHRESSAPRASAPKGRG